MKVKPIKVIYIAGPTRSGSTLLSNILGEIEAFFNAGELIDLWDRGIMVNGLCSCGLSINKCELWKAIFDKAFGGAQKIELQKIINIRNSYAHSSRVPKMIWSKRKKSLSNSHLLNYVEKLSQLYHAIQSVTQCNVIIDPSKNFGYAYILSLVPQIELYLLNLIRDPRAIAYSWQKKKEGLWRANPVETSLIWSLRNLIAELLQIKWSNVCLKMYYEDFVADPIGNVKKILDLIGEYPSKLPFIDDHNVQLSVNHSVYGNPDRFKAGQIRIKLDDRWKHMSKFNKLLVTALTWPLLIKNKYPLFA
jgi:hypothetical protein